MDYKTKLLFSAEEIPSIREKLKNGWYREAFELLISRADRLVNFDSPALDIIAPGHGKGTAQRQLEYKTGILAFAGHITGEVRYIHRGIEVYMNTIRKTHLEDFIQFNGHLCVGDAARAQATAYDMLAPWMTPSDRAYAINELQRLGEWLYTCESTWTRNHSGVESCNHSAVHFGGLGLAALVLGNQEDWLDWAAQKMRAYFKYSTDATGFMTEGLPYGCYGLLAAITFSEAYRRLRGIDIVGEFPKNAKIPNQLLAQTLPSQKRIVSFNDNLAEIPNLCGIMYLISKYKDSTALYWLQRISGKDGNGRYGSDPDGKMGDGTSLPYTLLWSDPSITPISPDEANYSTTTVTESGRVFVRESWEDKDKSMFFFTSGFDHHRGHNHADQNSFAFFAHGEEFLIDPPLIPNATECHNTVIIDGIGQTMPSRGEIVKFEDRGDSFFVSGDATEAYEWLSLLVGYARRNVLYVKGEVPYLVTFDDIQTEDDKEKTYSYMVHTGLDNVMEIKQDDIWIVGKSGATCRVRICSPKELKLSISDLSGKTVFRYVSQHKLADYYQEAKVDTVAKNPKFIAVITAAKDNAHPEVDIEHSKDRSIVTLTFRSGRIDKILVTKEDIKII